MLTSHSTSSALVLRSRGSAWSVDQQALARPGQNSLTAVSCSSASRCVVAGTAAASELGRPALLVADLDATGWEPLSGAVLPGFVESLACQDAARCLLVGNDGPQALNAELDSTGLHGQRSPTPDLGAEAEAGPSAP